MQIGHSCTPGVSADMKLRERCERLPVIVALGLYTVVVLRCAWLSDDAYITFRTIDNFLSGYGLTWNAGERVQAYTHPLWLLLLTPIQCVTGEPHLTTITASVVLSVGAVMLCAFALAGTPLAAAVGVMVFTLSKAFVDYSTSGLENPLSHFLLAGYLAVWLRRPQGDRSFLWLTALAGLVTLNRMDLALIVLPGVLVRAWERRSVRTLGMLLLGFAPFILWELWAFFYYGFPFPNTAYAKLNTQLPAGLLVRQGWFYFADSLTTDPLTPIMIIAGLLTPLLVGRLRHLPIIIGVVIYLAYVLRIGGDFMAGRFLTAPLFCAVVLLVTSPVARSTRALVMSLALVLLISLVATRPSLLSDERYGMDFDYMGPHGVADERAAYYQATGLLRILRGRPVPDHAWAREGRTARQAEPAVVVSRNIGFFGLAAGPRVHIVDEDGLADPLLARVPFAPGEAWRIGHFHRPVPDGYVETLRSGTNVISDPQLAERYETLTRITRGPLFDAGRLRAILRINFGLAG
jgi:arabinofuranosyltransferase